jgi:pilus assembly protein CpaF
VLYPVALNGPIVTIRKFSRDVMTMQELIRRESINREIDELMKKLVTARYNIFISGGTGSG